MDETHDRSLQERVAQLETVVAELQSMIKHTHEASIQKEPKEIHSASKDPVRDQTEAPSSPVKPALDLSQANRKTFELPENMRKSEYWLNKIGIGLVLFGVAFLFKYSVDQGWLTPPVRVGFGVILAVGLVVTGIRISTDRRHFSQVLIGGGIATFYITGFAAFQLFTLISYPITFTFMVSVTLLAFILSLKLDGAVLALIGAVGGLGTPFLLYTDAGNLPRLIAYTCLVLSGTSAIYFYRGWRSLLWISVIGGWAVILIGLNKGFSTDSQEAIADRWALQLGVVFGWLAFWTLPLIREVVWVKNPTRWPRPPFIGEKFISQQANNILDRYVHLLSVSTPLIVLGVSMPIWSLSNQTWGWITLGGGIVYGLTSWRLSRLNAIRHLSYTHSLVGAMLLAIAFYLLLDSNTLLFALAAEASVLHLIARRLSDKGVTIAAHLLFGGLGLWLVQRLFFYEQTEETAILNAQALTDLWVIGVASVVSILSISSKQRQVYLFLAHIVILGWFLRELSPLSHGQGYVTIAWGVYTIILLVLGLRLNFNQLRTVAMGTLLIVVVKLFLVDLVELETIWRILLFLGFGGLFLILSYYFRVLWKPSYEPSKLSD